MCGVWKHIHDANTLKHTAGFHPYFYIDPNKYQKLDLLLNFADPIERLNYNTTLTETISKDPEITNPISGMSPGLNEKITRQGNTHSVCLSFPDHHQLEIAMIKQSPKDLFSYIQLYHENDQDFFCIEPWMAPPNRLNSLDLAHHLAPGAHDSATFTLNLMKLP